MAAMLVAALALGGGTAVAQSVTVTIDNFSPRCVDPGGSSDVVVGGQATTPTGTVSVSMYAPDGTQLAGPTTVTVSNGRYSSSPFTINPRQPGNYEVRVSAPRTTTSVSAYVEVPCQNPTLEYNPTCFPVGYSGTVTMTARHFVPFGVGYMTYDVGGSEAQQAIRIPNDGHGVFVATFKVTPSNRDHPGQGTDANRSLVATATWSPCPPGTTTPTTVTTVVETTTSTPGTTVTTTATTLPGSTIPAVPSTTIPIFIPPPPPGVSLTVTPPLGPPGFVAEARGTGFPPGPVVLTWSPGIGTTTALAGPDGTFVSQVLVFGHDVLGPRALLASSGAVSAGAAFLVVPPTVQPSGKDVSQITRARRFLTRSG